ncbi:MAG: Eco57I restriction-modification methylase domain-containing protein, partial [Acidimicrobiales bacterium]
RALRDALAGGTLSVADYYRQLLWAVYRLIFVFVAEDRDLLVSPDASEVARRRYAEHYSLGRLRHIAETSRGSAHGDLWQGLSVVLGALANPEGEPALGLPALGSALFSPEATPDLDRAGLANRDLLAVIRALAFTSSQGALRQVDYANLGAEELGSVYEALLEQHPEVNVVARRFALATAAGNERKTTGSYYTPTPLIVELLNSALDPVLGEAAAAPDPEAAILGLAVLDPACGSGHFLIAAAHRIARRLAGVRTGEEAPAPEPIRTALRDVIGHCLYGVDVNPMAVELCKVACWMESLEPGKPLSFLDHRIVCGNSLLGATPALVEAGIPDEAFKVLVGDDKAVVASLKKRNRVERAGQSVLTLDEPARSGASPFASAFAALDALPQEEWSQVAEKARRFGELAGSPEAAQAALVANAWCAAFVIPKVLGAPVLTQLAWSQLRADPAGASPELVRTIAEAKDRYGFLHPHVAFPTVHERGGFDIVLGNPPWERVKLSEKEFFATRHPEIAEAAGAKRRKMIAALATDDPPLNASYLAALRHADGTSHLLRASGRYPLCGRGDVNTYAVFAEAMRDALGPRGRAGVIVPTGIATDDTTRHFFAEVVERSSLVSLFDFENAQPIFPGVHRSYKFCLLTLTGAERPARGGAEFVFFAHQVGDLGDPQRRFSLSAADLALLNPNTRTAPVFRTARDAELTKAIYRRVPVLVAEGPPERNPWAIRFCRLFD